MLREEQRLPTRGARVPTSHVLLPAKAKSKRGRESENIIVYLLTHKYTHVFLFHAHSPTSFAIMILASGYAFRPCNAAMGGNFKLGCASNNSSTESQ